MNPPSALEKSLLVFIVVAPLFALGYAIYELWNFLVGPTDIALLVGLYALSILGVGVGFHRMLTHKGFEAPAPVRFVFLALGSMALEGGCVEWAATHVKHHARSDREGDPHSPLEGFWHAHMGWLFSHGQKVEPLYYRGFDGDRVAQFVNRTFWFWAILGFVIPLSIGFWVGGIGGAWSGLIWGGFVRVFFNHHISWSVNSVCHTFGRQPFDTPDRSRNEWIVGLLGFGEGWHNNHHAFPRSAIHGFRWYQFDLSGYVIRLLAWFRLARDVVIVRKSQWSQALRRSKSPQAV